MTPDPLKVDEDSVLTWPVGAEPPYGVTADGHVFGFWQEATDRIRCIWDGIAGAPFDGVIPMRDETRTFWSDDGCHVAYMAMRSRRAFVGRDGAEDPAFDDITRSVPPVFSAGGAHLAYGAALGGSYRLIIDGARTNADELAPIAATFSPDGSRLAFVEMRKAAKEPEFRVVVGGTAGPWFVGMRNAQGVLQFSPDSRRFAYYRIDGAGHGQWIVDGVEHRWVDDVRPFGLAQLRGVAVLDPPMIATFSPDSRRFAYWADVKEKGVAVIEDDVPGPIVKAAGEPIFSPDSRHLAYGAIGLDGRHVMVRDGVAIASYDAATMGDPVFSPDGSRMAWVVPREEGGFLRKHSVNSLVLDGEVIAEQAGDDASRRPWFGPDGSRVAWWVRRGKEVVVLVGSDAGPGMAEGSEPFITASGRLVYAAKFASGQATVTVDHQPGPLAEDWLVPLSVDSGAYATDRFRISPDGEHVAWGGWFKDGARPVLDGRVGPAYDHVLSWSFDADGVATWWTQRGEAILRVRAKAI